MFESVKESIRVWNMSNSDRVKLQHIYIVTAISLLVIAGVLGLVNRELGQNILVAAIVSAALFLVNAVTWSLVQSAILSRTSAKRTVVTARTRKK